MSERDGKTTLTQTILYNSRETRDAVLKSPMQTGMAMSYDRLEKFLPLRGARVERVRKIYGEGKKPMQKIVPFLWFDGNAEEAMNFYTSIFKNSKVGEIRRCGDGPGPKGSLLTAKFQIEGQEFMALNGGPHFKFTPAISFFVNCETQKEVDELWEKLLAGGKAMQCGWLTDKFGISWQIIPKALGELMGDKDPQKSQRVMKAMMKMIKIDVEGLKRAYEGKE